MTNIKIQLRSNVNSMLRIKTKYLYVLVCFIALNKLFTKTGFDKKIDNGDFS